MRAQGLARAVCAARAQLRRAGEAATGGKARECGSGCVVRLTHALARKCAALARLQLTLSSAALHSSMQVDQVDLAVHASRSMILSDIVAWFQAQTQWECSRQHIVYPACA